MSIFILEIVALNLINTGLIWRACFQFTYFFCPCCTCLKSSPIYKSHQSFKDYLACCLLIVSIERNFSSNFYSACSERHVGYFYLALCISIFTLQCVSVFVCRYLSFCKCALWLLLDLFFVSQYNSLYIVASYDSLCK